MGETFTRPFLRDDKETEVEVEIEVSSWGSAPMTSGPPEACHDGDPMECEVIGAWLVEYTLANVAFRGAPVILTAEEYERAEREFCEDPPEPDYPEDYD